MFGIIFDFLLLFTDPKCILSLVKLSSDTRFLFITWTILFLGAICLQALVVLTLAA